ncbi:hypothetical protein LSH36_765g01045 [Paralvinella palmiformis]|uniref:Uncharacterized protein n=1 Tax=Paralvinella palmiformis TaxID=53620 RepID=A0AAD9J1R4_9ANNE|nr:hypothetical protein LSH36_765g01045 [Paralvinella palmiformis]
MIKLAIFVVTLAKLTAAQHGYGGYGVSDYGGGQRGYGGGNRGYGGGNRGYGGRNGGYGVKKSYGGGYGVNVDYYSYQSYNGLYPGKCGADGFYYNDASTIILCSNGNAYVQPCAPGSKNSGQSRYQYGKDYSYNDFCDVNLVDYGYGAHFGGYGDYGRSQNGYGSGNYGYSVGYRGGGGGYGYNPYPVSSGYGTD